VTGLRQLLDADDVAAALGVSRDWVYGEVRAGRIPHVRLGRCVRFRAEVIEEWLKSLENGAIITTTTTSAPARR
jgi:excisionase family DNA binding protein